MKTIHCLLVAGLLLHGTPVFAHDSQPIYRPESHAPADVMADHLHKQGEWMVGYRYLVRNFSGIYQGSDTIDSSVAAMAGYSSVADNMKMEMHMLDIMYAVNDDVTLMLMPQYMSMDMEMEATPMAMPMSSHGGHAAHDHKTSGVGDTAFAALVRLHRSGNQQVHATLGLSAPTGSVDEKMPDGRFVHYGMQLGSGTWDFVPGVTYTGYSGAISWGAQAGAVLRLGNENDSGYQLGDKYSAMGWGAFRFADWGSVSLRLEYEKEGDINGHYNGTHNHSSPPDFQANYGGEFVDLGVGFNLVQQSGPLSGVRLGVEWIKTVDEKYNGIQTGRDDGWSLSLTYAF